MPYDGPYLVIKRGAKHFVVHIKGNDKTICINRLKPVFGIHYDTIEDSVGKSGNSSTVKPIPEAVVRYQWCFPAQASL